MTYNQLLVGSILLTVTLNTLKLFLSESNPFRNNTYDLKILALLCLAQLCRLGIHFVGFSISSATVTDGQKTNLNQKESKKSCFDF